MKREFGASLLVFVAIAVVFVAVYFVIIPNLPQSNTEIRVGDGIFKATVANDEESRAKGLDGTGAMQDGRATLLVYPTDDRWTVDVSNNVEPVDILWLNSSKKIVHVVKNASRDSATKIFSPRINARYVMGMPAGTVDSKSILYDSTAIFDVTAEIK
jgi:uncharacterized membrane protein (UPF0127 family)